MAKTILLTGGAGFIGSHVAKNLLLRGDSVIIVDNFNNAYHRVLKNHNLAGVERCNNENRLIVYEIDICDEQKMDHIFAEHQPDAVCHLAARAGVRESIRSSSEYIRTNIVGTNIIFKMAVKYKVPHIVAASSSTVYGTGNNGAFKEDDFAEAQSSPYGATKRAAELLAYVYHYLYGISITNLRFFSVYGPHCRVDMAPLIFMDALYYNKAIIIFGDGTVVRDFTYIDDIVGGIVKAIDTPMGYQTFNLGRGEPVMLSDFIAIMEQIVGRSATIIHSTSFAADAPRTHANIDKAKSLLHYVPSVSLVDGLEVMYQWYKTEYLPLRECTIKKNMLDDVPVVVCDLAMTLE
jgi:UDP-glucuronate 4-epimerase